MLLLLRRRAAPAPTPTPQRKRARDDLDTVAGLAARSRRALLTIGERAAPTRCCVKALPDYMVLAQVPLARFMRVPTRHSYAEWLKRVGHLSADLLVCDTARAGASAS